MWQKIMGVYIKAATFTRTDKGAISGCRSNRRFGLEDLMISAYFFQKAIILLS